MALWIFGDSYSIETTAQDKNFHNHYDKNWIDHVSDDLNEHDVRVCSEYGVSNDFIFAFFLQHANDFKSGDHVIVQLTSPARKWFFEKEPYLSNFVQTDGWYDKEKKKAADSYLVNLQNNNLDNIQYTSYIYALQFITSTRTDVKTLLLPGFASIPGVIGNLTDNVCNNELLNTKKFFDSHKGQDPRLNHMSPENHKILGDKIIDYFKNNTVIDLTKDFIGNLY